MPANELPYPLQVNEDVTTDNSDKTVIVPVNEEWEIERIDVLLTTTATVGNRLMLVDIGDGATLLHRAVVGVLQPASLTFRYTFAEGLVRDTSGNNEVLFSPIPHLRLPAGYTIRVADRNAVDAAADDMSVWITYARRQLATS